VDAHDISYSVWVTETNGDSHWLYLDGTRFETPSLALAAVKASECRREVSRFTKARVRSLDGEDGEELDKCTGRTYYSL